MNGSQTAKAATADTVGDLQRLKQDQINPIITAPPAQTQGPSVKTPNYFDQERVIATVRLGTRSFIRISVRDGCVIIRKFTANDRRIFLPTGLPLKLKTFEEARDLIAGITAAAAEVWK